MASSVRAHTAIRAVARRVTLWADPTFPRQEASGGDPHAETEHLQCCSFIRKDFHVKYAESRTGGAAPPGAGSYWPGGSLGIPSMALAGPSSTPSAGLPPYWVRQVSQTLQAIKGPLGHGTRAWPSQPGLLINASLELGIFVGWSPPG